MRLVIVIPALNEEASVGHTIDACLAAAERIRNETEVEGVELVVVSDGSTDSTPDIARSFGDRVKLIDWRENRGYGAAIKAGWNTSDAELVAFIDADGTCDPNMFVDLVQATTAGADMALGCRMHAGSEMPRIRRFGNRVFAQMLSTVSARRVRDSASGMRVLRRACLPHLVPLPDGLHFTPAMSARAMLTGAIKVAEIDMPYREREGRSKLSVVRDGLRFLDVILHSALLHRPARLLGLAAMAFAVLGALIMLPPIIFYVAHGRLQEWMIYRFIVSSVLGTMAALLISVAYLAERVIDLALGPQQSRLTSTISRFLASRGFFLAPAALVLLGGVLIAPAALSLIRTGHTALHWSRFVVMSFVVVLAAILVVTKIFERFIQLFEARQELLQSEPTLVGVLS